MRNRYRKSTINRLRIMSDFDPESVPKSQRPPMLIDDRPDLQSSCYSVSPRPFSQVACGFSRGAVDHQDDASLPGHQYTQDRRGSQFSDGIRLEPLPITWQYPETFEEADIAGTSQGRRNAVRIDREQQFRFQGYRDLNMNLNLRQFSRMKVCLLMLGRCIIPLLRR